MPNSKLSPNEPWLHGASGFWCKKVAGGLHYLDRDYDVAKRKLTKLLRELERGQAGDRDWLQATFGELCDAYLDEVKGLRESTTYEGYRYRLLRALKILGPRIRVAEVRGKPYSKDRFVKIMCRARKRAGIETKGGEQLVLYSQA